MEIRPEYGILQQFLTKSYLEYMSSTQLSLFDFFKNKKQCHLKFFHHILLNETKYKSFIHNVIKCRHVW